MMKPLLLTLLVLCCFNGIHICSADDKAGALTLVQIDENDEDVTVEVNGEDKMKTSEPFEISTEEFYPTHEWQTVKAGQAIPAGLHVRLNMETGEREAKLMEGDSELKYWKAGDREGMINTKKKQFSVDELKKALKDFKTTKLDDTNLEREDHVKSKFRSYKELKENFEKMNVDIKTDGQIVEGLLNKLKKEETEGAELLMALQDLEYYLHQYDNAVAFKDYGGLGVLVKLLNTSNNDEIKMEAAMVVGASTSSNPQVQISAVEAGVLHILLKMMSTEASIPLRRKVLYAVSSICRNFPHAQKRFLQLGGLSVLSKVFKESDAEKIQIKAVSFLNDLLVEKEDALQFTNKDKSSEVEKLRQYNQVPLREAMVEQGWCEQIPTLLIFSEHDSREQVLKTMKTLCDTCKDKFVMSRTVLSDLQKQYKVLADKDSDEYYDYMVTLVEELIELLKVKDEL